MVSFRDPETLPQWIGVPDCVPLGPGEWKGQSFEEGGGRVSFILFLCDFYQNTEIQHTHKPAQKRSALFTATAGTCPPGQPPAGWGGRGGQPHQQGEKPRQERTEGGAGAGGGDHRETKRNKVKLQETAARRGTLGTLLLPLPTKDSESKAKEGGCRERGEIEAHRTWEESGRGSPGGRNGTKCHPKSPTPLCHFPLSCQHIWFPQMPLPHKPPPTPSTPPLDPGHPNTGGKEIFRRLSYLQYRPSPSPSPSLYRDR